MSKIAKKSLDPNVNKVLSDLHQQNIDLSWDLHEAGLPKCGFGDLGLCCDKCWQGPCRVDPFGNGSEKGSCGRDGLAMVVENLARQVMNGLSPVLEEVEDNDLMKEYLQLNNWINGGMNYSAEKLLHKLFEISGNALKSTSSKGVKLEEVEIDPSKKTVVVAGKITAADLKLLKKDESTQIFALLNEFFYPEVQPLTNYGSQEAVLAAGIPDLLVIGPGCGKPNLISLAEKYDISYLYSGQLSAEKLGEVVNRGRKNFIQIGSSFNQVNYSDLKGKKLALIAGCNNIRQTQDEKILKLAGELLEKGYSIVTSGCAAMALNKYLADSEDIYYLGTCFETPQFIEVYKELKDVSGQIAAFFPELSQSKALAQAVGLAANGINTYILSAAPVGGSSEFENILTGVNQKLELAGKGFTVEDVLDQIL